MWFKEPEIFWTKQKNIELSEQDLVTPTLDDLLYVYQV